MKIKSEAQFSRQTHLLTQKNLQAVLLNAERSLMLLFLQ